MANNHDDPARDERLTTGVPGLDKVLSGGFPLAATYVLQGAPGAGKTLLASQIGFYRVAQGESVIYVTLLAESHARLLHNLRKMRFYREKAVNSEFTCLSGFQILHDEGLEGVLKLIQTEIRSRKASLLVLDGLFVLQESAGSPADFRRFINNIETLSLLLRCTILLLTSDRFSPEKPEYTMVDGWVELDHRVVGHRAVRELNVRKLRSSDYLSGRHPLKITNDGVEITPRLESINTNPYPASPEVVSSGIHDLDEVLGGGVPRASTSVIVGASGSGKTSFGLSFLNECTPEQPGLYYGFYETPARIEQKAAQLGLDLQKLVQERALQIVWKSPGDYVADGLAKEILDVVDRCGVRRLVIDGLAGLRRALVYPERAPLFFSALSNELRLRDVTTFYTANSPSLLGGELEIKLPEQSALAECIVLLRYMGLRTRLHRTVSVVKVRDRPFDPSVFRFTIGDSGIRFGESLAEGLESPGGASDSDSSSD